MTGLSVLPSFFLFTLSCPASEPRKDKMVLVTTDVLGRGIDFTTCKYLCPIVTPEGYDIENGIH